MRAILLATVLCCASAAVGGSVDTSDPGLQVVITLAPTTVTPWGSSAWKASLPGSIAGPSNSIASFNFLHSIFAQEGDSSASDPSGSQASFGSTQSASSGLYFQVWQWFALGGLECIACAVCVGLCGAKKKKDKKKAAPPAAAVTPAPEAETAPLLDLPPLTPIGAFPIQSYAAPMAMPVTTSYAAPVEYVAAPVQYAAPMAMPMTTSYAAPVQYAAAPVQYAAAPVQYAAAPVQYAAAPVQYVSSTAPVVTMG